MKITVSKDKEIMMHREDVVSITDKGGAYEVIYEDKIGQLIYKDKDEDISIKIN